MKTLVPLLLPLLFGPASVILAQTTPAPQKTGAPQKAQSQKAQEARKTQAMVTRILRETSALRGLAIKSEVKSGLKSRAQIEAMLRGKVRDELPSDQLMASEIFLRQLSLAPADYALKASYIAMMGEQIAGYYDTKTKIFVTTDRVDPLQLETVMAHELTHALQDQHFDISNLEKWPAHDSDARLAAAALVEGDATLVMSRYTAQNPLRFMGVLASALRGQAASPTFSKAPRMLREGVTFPYLQGMQFATNLYRRGGWNEVSDAFSRLPQSSEQILHPEKYFAREAPQKVEVRDLSRLLGNGWRLLDHDVNGEFGLLLTVAEHLKDERAAQIAAAGWGGDRYSVYRGPRGAVLVVQDCRWDSEFDARQWREAYARSTSQRFGTKPSKRGALEIWNAAPKGVWMQARGRRVVILEGTAMAFNPDAVLANLWR